jgi:3-phosphoshikimate 1-carboxyvinyltransferase
MTRRFIEPASSVVGELCLPGDKSIAHRAALIGAISEGDTMASNFPSGADCLSTLRCLGQLGVRVERSDSEVRIGGRGLGGLLRAKEPLDAGNSGTTVRLLSGILAAHPFVSTLVGDASLNRRPMARIVEPLSLFGARIRSDDGRLPLEIQGGALRAIAYRLPVASAQVKSAVLLAGAHASGTTRVEEPVPTRNHTEIALCGAGARIMETSGAIEIVGGVPLLGRTLRIPGDVSSAAFFIAAALGLAGSDLRLKGVGANPGRTGFQSLLAAAGADIEWAPCASDEFGGEPAGDIRVRSSAIGAIGVDAAMVPALVDEIPMLAVLGAGSGKGADIRGAGELRHKETDRIRALVRNLNAVGVEADELDDGLRVEPSPTPHSPIRGGQVDSFGDHRIAMAFAIGGLFSREGIEIDDAGCVDVSFPGFFDVLESLVRRD